MTDPIYVATITPSDKGRFIAVLAKPALVSVRSDDAHHDLCHEMVKNGLPDGRIEFWQDGKLSITFLSVHRSAKYRISMGDRFPALVKRREWPSDGIKTGGRSDATSPEAVFGQKDPSP